eukprot:8820866-Pyramimonas_sp.AAC.2
MARTRFGRGYGRPLGSGARDAEASLAYHPPWRRTLRLLSNPADVRWTNKTKRVSGHTPTPPPV